MESEAINKSMKAPEGEPRPSGPKREALCPTTVDLEAGPQGTECHLLGGGTSEHPWKPLYLGLGLFRGDFPDVLGGSLPSTTEKDPNISPASLLSI